ncbi:MAG TPA: methyltransferase [Methylomirabilota bacterium]
MSTQQAAGLPTASEAGGELGLPGLVDLALGYQRAQVLLTANSLDLFRLLAEGPRTAPEVAAALGAELRGVEALLDACVSLRILHHGPTGYENSRTARLFLLPTQETSLGPVLRFWQRHGYPAWGRLASSITGRATLPDETISGDVFERIQDEDEHLRLFCDGLASLAHWPARRVAALVDLSRRRHLLDLGGGSGVFSATIALRFPRLRITLFDLPPVSALARERFGRIDSEGRLQAVSGDFFRDSLPAGCDAVLVSHVLHDWPPDACVQLLRKIHDALPEEGELIVHDFMPPARGMSCEASLFELTLVLDTPRGRVYTSPEIRRWLEETGFGGIRHEAVAGGTSLLIGVKSAGSVRRAG